MLSVRDAVPIGDRPSEIQRLVSARLTPQAAPVRAWIGVVRQRAIDHDDNMPMLIRMSLFGPLQSRHDELTRVSACPCRNPVGQGRPALAAAERIDDLIGKALKSYTELIGNGARKSAAVILVSLKTGFTRVSNAIVSHRRLHGPDTSLLPNTYRGFARALMRQWLTSTRQGRFRRRPFLTVRRRYYARSSNSKYKIMPVFGQFSASRKLAKA